MTMRQIIKFCGNPFNHDAHSYGDNTEFWCEGVQREEPPAYIEKYDPTEQAEDGTPYSEITITIKDKNGIVTTIHAPKASFLQFEVEHTKYVAVDVVDGYQPPRIEKATLSFEPYQYNEPPYTITREKIDET